MYSIVICLKMFAVKRFHYSSKSSYQMAGAIITLFYIIFAGFFVHVHILSPGQRNIHATQTADVHRTLAIFFLLYAQLKRIAIVDDIYILIISVTKIMCFNNVIVCPEFKDISVLRVYMCILAIKYSVYLLDGR